MKKFIKSNPITKVSNPAKPHQFLQKTKILLTMFPSYSRAKSTQTQQKRGSINSWVENHCQTCQKSLKDDTFLPSRCSSSKGLLHHGHYCNLLEVLPPPEPSSTTASSPWRVPCCRGCCSAWKRGFGPWNLTFLSLLSELRCGAS